MLVRRYYTMLTFLLVGIGLAYSQESNIRVCSDSCADSTLVYTLQQTKSHEPWSLLYVKTNSIGWVMAVTNVAVEVNLEKHWSLALPFYWSGWNYFKTTRKYRTFTVQPEIRYWFQPVDNGGLYAGAHLGLGWYNFALDGTYRIQDHKGRCPSFGLGVSGGYRLPISHNKRWHMEFSLGVGTYSAKYDRFWNHKNGLLVDTKCKTWFGIDQAAASIVYTFDLKRKGGTR